MPRAKRAAELCIEEMRRAFASTDSAISAAKSIIVAAAQLKVGDEERGALEEKALTAAQCAAEMASGAVNAAYIAATTLDMIGLSGDEIRTAVAIDKKRALRCKRKLVVCGCCKRSKRFVRAASV